MGYSPWGRKESDTTEQLLLSLKILLQIKDSFLAVRQLILVKWYLDVIKIQVLLYLRYSATKFKILDCCFHLPVLQRVPTSALFCT